MALSFRDSLEQDYEDVSTSADTALQHDNYNAEALVD
jgi:hypothetical protein